MVHTGFSETNKINSHDSWGEYTAPATPTRENSKQQQRTEKEQKWTLNKQQTSPPDPIAVNHSCWAIPVCKKPFQGGAWWRVANYQANGRYK